MARVGGNPDLKKYRFKKGKTGNPDGRPRKYVSLLKEQGYKVSEVNDTIQAMMAMDEKELNEVDTNPKATILERTIAGAMLKSMDKKSLYSLETLLTRVHGQPKETVDANVNATLKVNVSFNEATEEKTDGETT